MMRSILKRLLDRHTTGSPTWRGSRARRQRLRRRHRHRQADQGRHGHRQGHHV